MTETDGRTGRAARKRAERRRTILETSLQVFSDKGYHHARVSDIIEAAGISRGTFYLYFDSKSAIFHELLDMLLKQIRANVIGVETEGDVPPMRDQLLDSLRRVLTTFRENPDLTRVVLFEAVGLDEEVDARLRAFYTNLHGWLVESLENGQAMGFIRECDPVAVSWCIIGSVKQLLERILDDDGDVEHLALVLLEYNLLGIMKTY